MKARRTKRFQSHIYYDESGITGLETAIILIAFIVVAAVFAFTIMTTGLFSSERAKTVARSGLSEAASSLTLKGPVSAEAHNIGQPYGQVPVKLVFQVGLVGRVGEHVSLKLDELAFRYIDEQDSHSFGVPRVSPFFSEAKLEREAIAELYLYRGLYSYKCDSDNGAIGAVDPIKQELGWSLDHSHENVIAWVVLCWIIENSENQILESGELAELTLFYNFPNTFLSPKSGTRFRLEMIPPGGTVFTFERTFPRSLEKIMTLE